MATVQDLKEARVTRPPCTGAGRGAAQDRRPGAPGLAGAPVRAVLEVTGAAPRDPDDLAALAMERVADSAFLNRMARDRLKSSCALAQGVNRSQQIAGHAVQERGVRHALHGQRGQIIRIGEVQPRSTSKDGRVQAHQRGQARRVVGPERPSSSACTRRTGPPALPSVLTVAHRPVQSPCIPRRSRNASARARRDPRDSASTLRGRIHSPGPAGLPARLPKHGHGS